MVKTYFLVEIESEYEVAADTLAQNIQNRFPTSVESVKVEAVEQPLALDDAHVCGWCKGKQELVWSCPVCDVG